MTDIRENLADVIDGAHAAGAVCDEYALADAILAALPDMVPDLAWSEIDERTAFSRRRYVSGGYIIEYRLHGQHFDLWVGHNATCADRYNTLESAKAAANAHHRATWFAALTGGDQ
ncbi:hypothetical protein [Pseudosulfitobacter pseudonitzschiae]|uniref:hypothetical protein n=1 Tax=Pseudosulfitobacter pseudonitzschiae TaxID=1402135 RepID=UPI001AF7F681|nr:hypothetical protein [Pseudosulfitobacter pseudonitzschiae]MBM1817198.1 hypothetical protein [Pseudosulfitobacter pseudonitzschiae]MBM1834209.1 hypothetical protein [Pseudosulfitobacter pseudonitzschiae]MBM1839074.1 hypothetical protein [Pseudosulfitobacter pseudonitzschiae]MBM1843922.1 hypothetical protein [Pseudosulfitobacter pseudonitzschiae]MBM1848759.1 hypothetical protein [Pseudosulfitobacter pseudonitzschiae]